MKLQHLIFPVVVLASFSSCVIAPAPVYRPRPVIGGPVIGPPVVLPGGARPYYHGGVRYYSHRGTWYGPHPHGRGHIIVPRPF